MYHFTKNRENRGSIHGRGKDKSKTTLTAMIVELEYFLGTEKDLFSFATQSNNSEKFFSLISMIYATNRLSSRWLIISFTRAVKVAMLKVTNRPERVSRFSLSFCKRYIHSIFIYGTKFNITFKGNRG